MSHFFSVAQYSALAAILFCEAWMSELLLDSYIITINQSMSMLNKIVIIIIFIPKSPT